MDKKALREAVERTKDSLENPPDIYIEGWEHESGQWEQLGMYRKAAEVIDPKAGGIHVDLGSGLAHLPEQIKLRRPDSAVIGVEYRPQMIRRATQRLVGNIVPVISFETAKMRVTDDCLIETDYDLPNEYMPEIDTGYGSPIILINDDIRKRAVLAAALGKRRIDSGSFSFFGGSEPLQLQAPFLPIRLSQEDIDDRYKVLNSNIRNEAVTFFSERTKPGGCMLIMDRFSGLNITPNLLLEFIRTQLIKNGKYWDNDVEVYILEKSVRHSGGDIGWSRTMVPAEIDACMPPANIAPANVYIAKFIRNNVAFTTEG